MTTFVLDTNIISFYLAQKHGIADKIESTLASGNDVIIAPTYYECKRGLLSLNANRRMEIFISLCEDLGVGEMSSAILDVSAKIYARLRKIGRPVEDADLFMAAFCLIHGHTLVTNNAKHFENIENLKTVDWTVE